MEPRKSQKHPETARARSPETSGNCGGGGGGGAAVEISFLFSVLTGIEGVPQRLHHDVAVPDLPTKKPRNTSFARATTGSWSPDVALWARQNGSQKADLEFISTLGMVAKQLTVFCRPPVKMNRTKKLKNQSMPRTVKNGKKREGPLRPCTNEKRFILVGSTSWK